MKRTMIIAGCAIALAGGAQAGLPTAGETGQAAIASNVAVTGLPVWVLPTDRLARRGADDPAGDDHGRRHGGHGADDGAGHAMNAPAGTELMLFARNGADDPAGDDRGRRHGGHGADDGAGHAMNAPAGTELMLFARNGADDGAGDDHGGHGGHGGGHGADDGADDGASGSGRSKPRVPGGSGCDDPGDVREHASCRG